MEENPYQASEVVVAEEVGSRDPFHEIGQVVVAWEKLRWVYNAALTVFVILMITFSGRIAVTRPMPMIVLLVTGAVLANLCFCAGPLVDGYLTWFGLRHRNVTIVLFVFGTLFAIFLTMVTLQMSPNI